jgi:hypothetical protein
MTEQGSSRGGVHTVYLHVGAFKTGTTYLQDVMRLNSKALAAQGVLFPGAERWRTQVAGVSDLLGIAQRGDDAPDKRGGWNELVRQIKEWDGPSALVSMEFLSMAGPRQARRAVRALDPAEVHVVLTARDLARTVPAMWQETLKAGGTWTWDEYIAALRDDDRSAVPPALGFWICQDLPAVLDVWERSLGRERIHLVTVPPPGADPRLLLERFCEAVGVDLDLLADQAPRSNQSLGAAEAEALRLLNVSLGSRADRHEYRKVIKQVVGRHLSETTPKSGQMRLPSEDRPWAVKRAREMADELAQRDYHVVGDLEDLVPSDEDSSPGRVPWDVTEREVLEASTRAAAAVVRRLAHQRASRGAEAAPTNPGLRQGFASDARVAVYRAKRRLAAVSARNRIAAKAVTLYRRNTLKGRKRR